MNFYWYFFMKNYQINFTGPSEARMQSARRL